MRQIGYFDRETEARRFAAYLATEGIGSHAEQDDSKWAIWVRDENQVDTARQAYEDFRFRPDDPRYQDVERAADSIRREEARRRAQAGKNVVEVRAQWGRLAARRIPLVATMVALSILVGLASRMGRDFTGTVMKTLLFADPFPKIGLGELTAAAPRHDPLAQIKRGELWRLVTPIFVHYGTVHLAFNMIMFYQLGSVIEDRRGTWRMGLMILAIAAVSNVAQSLVPASWGGSPYAAGMSGVVYGLFGYVWMKTLYAPQLGLFVSRSTVFVLMLWLMLGIFGILGRFGMNIANWTHGIGLLAGVLIGYVPTVWKPGRTA